MSKQIVEECVTDFNSTLLDFATKISVLFPCSVIGANINIIRPMLTTKDENTKHKIIHIFILKVLPYKQQIDSGDEQFFLNKSFNEDTNDNNMLNNIFEIKKLWKQLNNENKENVKRYMQLLCEISQEYLQNYKK